MNDFNDFKALNERVELNPDPRPLNPDTRDTMKQPESSSLTIGGRDLLLGPLTIISVAFFLLYFKTITVLIRGFLRPGGSYGIVIVAISLWMIWAKKDQLRELTISPRILPGTALTVLACVMLITGKLSSTMLLQYLSMILTLCGLILLVWGRHYLRALLLPLLYLVLMFPLMEELLAHFSNYLQSIAAVIGYSLLKLGGMPAYHSGHVIELPHITLRVARSCNGINHIIALVALGIPLAHWTQRTWLRKAVFVVFAVFVAFFVNGLRVALIGIWTAYYPGSSFHGPFNIFYTFFILFSGMAILFLAAGLTRVRQSVQANRKNAKPSRAGAAHREPIQARSRLSQNEPSELLLPKEMAGSNGGLVDPAKVNEEESRPRDLNRQARSARGVAPVSIALFLLIATNAYLHFYKTRPVDLHTPLAAFPAEISGWTGHDVDLTDQRLLQVGADSHLYRIYRHRSGNEIRLYIGYFAEQQQNKEIVHYSLDWLHYDAEVIPIPLGSAKAEIKQTASSREGKSETIYFWYDVNGRILVDRYETKLKILLDAFLRRRTNGALVMISWANDGRTQETSALQFVQAILPVTQSFLNNHR